MRLQDVLILGEQLVPPVEADTNIVNQDSGKNYTMRLLGALTLGKQSALVIEVNTDTVN